MQDTVVRQSGPDDLGSIERLYAEAFPNEDLLPLIKHLLMQEPDILSLVAVTGQALVGHILFTIGSITNNGAKVALLAPLAVTPSRQQQGIGSALIREGLAQLKSAGIAKVLVLGDPAYYARSGFKAETGVAPPYPLPEKWREAWQSLSLSAAPQAGHGQLLLPEVWMQPALWRP